MALPVLADVKSYLRIDTTAEDTLVSQLLTRAMAAIERELGYPLLAVSLAYTKYEERDNFGQRPQLALPGPFKTTNRAPAVSDIDGEIVDSSDYVCDPRNLRLLAAPGVYFNRRPYTIVADVGLDAHPDYAARLESIASIAIIDLIAHWYLNRNPALASGTDEGGASAVLERGEIPTRVMDSINELPGRNGGMVVA